MVMGNYTVPQLRALGVRDAMQFHPELVVNGQPTITSGTGGWGYDPRTAIGQRRDGTVIFVVLNGRFHGGAGLGASQRQVMDLMLQYGAVNACAMDGGSSSVLYYDGRIINSPSTIDPNGQRHLPDAWLVFPSEAAANAYDPGLVSD
jgi:exopolysaccharide biosynthesis protein